MASQKKVNVTRKKKKKSCYRFAAEIMQGDKPKGVNDDQGGWGKKRHSFRAGGGM